MRRCRNIDIRTGEAEAGMGKATRIRQQNAREKIAAQRVAARRADIGVIDRKVRCAPALEAIRQRAMVVGEKRPGEKGFVGH